MIHTIRTVAVGDQESKIDSPIILYRGDREVEVEFTINGSKFTFTNGGNVIKSTNATHGQLVINTPTGENMFSEVTECHDGKVVFVITKEMIDELIEVGFYSFQIRLFDESQVSRVTIPPVLKGIDIRNPIAAEDETNVVDIALVDYSVIVKDQFEDLSTFLPDGNYNKTEWESKDVISGAKLNKIEDALYNINSNMEATDLALLNRVENINKNVYGEIQKLGGELESEVEEFEREMNKNFEIFKIDTNGDIGTLMGEIDNLRDDMLTGDNNVKNELLSEINSAVALFSNYGILAESFYNGDWSQAINNAIRYAYDNKYNKVILPSGELLISAPILGKYGICLTGQSRGTTILKASDVYNDYVIKVIGGGDTTLSVNKFTLENMKIDLGASMALGGLMIDWCYIFQLNNIEVVGGGNPDLKCFYLSNMFNCLVESCRVANGNRIGTGFYVTSSSPGENVTQVKMTDCLAQYCDIGVHVNLLTGGSEISYENSGLGKNNTNIIVEGNTTNVDIRLNHIERATNGVVLRGNALRCVNIELNDFFDVYNSIIIQDAVRYVDIKCNRFNGDGNGGTALVCRDNVENVALFGNDIIVTNYKDFDTGGVYLTIYDEMEMIHNNNISSIPSLGYKTKHYRFKNTSNVQIGQLPKSIHGHTVTFYFDDFSRFYRANNLIINNPIGLSGSIITMRYNALDEKWYEVCRSEKSAGTPPTTGNFSGGMKVWNSTLRAGDYLYWVYIEGAWVGFDKIDI